MLYSRTLLFIHSIYRNTLCLQIVTWLSLKTWVRLLAPPAQLTRMPHSPNLPWRLWALSVLCWLFCDSWHTEASVLLFSLGGFKMLPPTVWKWYSESMVSFWKNTLHFLVPHWGDVFRGDPLGKIKGQQEAAPTGDIVGKGRSVSGHPCPTPRLVRRLGELRRGSPW